MFVPFFDHCIGVDIDAKSVAKAKAMGVANVTFLHVAAADLGDFLDKERFDVVMLYAVLEHLTLTERIDLLRQVWSRPPPDGHLMVAEAPNRIAPIDYHSSRLPYCNQLPIALAGQVLDRSPRKGWVERVRQESSLELGLYRYGQHVGFDEFDLTAAPQGQLQQHVCADGRAPELLNLYPLRWFEPRNLSDFVGHRTDTDLGTGPDIAPAFARYWIDMSLSRHALPDPVGWCQTCRGRPTCRSTATACRSSRWTTAQPSALPCRPMRPPARAPRRAPSRRDCTGAGPTGQVRLHRYRRAHGRARPFRHQS